MRSAIARIAGSLTPSVIGRAPGRKLAGAAQVGRSGKEERVAGEPLRQQRAGDFALPLQQHAVDGGAIHRQRQGLAHARIVEARGEDQRQHAYRR